MRRTLSWLVAGALAASLGGASVASSTDSFIPIQDPPQLAIGTLYQAFGTGDVTRATDRIYPTASATTARSGFFESADADEVSTDNTRATFDYSRTPTTDQVRVPDGGAIATAPIYTQTVTVTTNGPIGAIERVGLCVLNSSDTAVRDNSSFEWYDSATNANDSNDVERNCGFSDEDPTDEETMVDARSGFAIIYDVTDDTFRFNDATTEHLIVLPTSRETSRSSEETGYGSYAVFSDVATEPGTITVQFGFKPSHALLKQSGNWIIRAAAQDQPPQVGEETFSPQKSEIYYGQGSGEQSEGELTDSSTTFRDAFTEISVAYYGAIVSERQDVDYGTLTKGQSKAVNSIDAGRYLANSPSKLWIDATNFTESTDTLVLTDGIPQDRQVRLQCSYSDDFASPGDYTVTDVMPTPALLGGTAGAIDPTTGLSTASPSSTEASEILGGGTVGTMSCQLTYGGDAEFAAKTYTNSVTLSIADNETAIP